MSSTHRVIAIGLAAAISLLAGGKHNPEPPNTAEIRVSNETIPAGGTVQAKFEMTEPHPITSTGASFELAGMSVDGVAVWSPLGDAGGVGVVKNGQLHIAAISPSASLGTVSDYPLLTITADVPSSAAPGSSFPLTLGNDSTLMTADGPMAIAMKPGTLVIGGSLSVRGVYPGGGTWPAGTLVRIMGTGFNRSTRVSTKFKTSSISFVNADEIDIVLKEQTTLDAQQVTVVNSDGLVDSYFSYARGVLVRKPSKPLLRISEPAFPQQTHAIASMTVPSLNASQFAALALQNSDPGPLVVTLELDSATGGHQTASVTLRSGARILDDLSTLLNGAQITAGDTVRLTSTAPVRILGLIGDESAITVTPLLLTF